MLLDPEVPKRQLLTQVTFKEKKEETLAVVVGRNIAGASAARVGGFGFGAHFSGSTDRLTTNDQDFFWQFDSMDRSFTKLHIPQGYDEFLIILSRKICTRPHICCQGEEICNVTGDSCKSIMWLRKVAWAAVGMTFGISGDDPKAIDSKDFQVPCSPDFV